VLRTIAERRRSNIREVDILGRYGGEEFTIILPEAGPTESQAISERLRKHIARMPITTTAGPVSVTISLGTANLTPDVPNLSKLIDCADFAMYEAKRREGIMFASMKRSPHNH
jgi:diguanylate cyclase (GGDEF)-like protein